MKHDLISIIVPVYNSEDTVATCLESLINQSYSKLEIIIVDDGSRDDSCQICKEYCKKDSRIQVVEQSNHGPSSARNRGIERATGEWILFVDSDDILDLEACRKSLEVSYKNDSDCILFNLKNIYSKTSKELIAYDEQYKEWIGEEDINNLQKDIIVNCSGINLNFTSIIGPVCKLIKKEIITGIHFDESLDLGEDTCFVLQMLSKCKKVSYFSEVLYSRKMIESSLSNKKDINYSYRVSKFTNKIKLLYSDQMILFEQEIIRFQVWNYYKIIRNYASYQLNLSMKLRKKYIDDYVNDTEYNRYIWSQIKESLTFKERVTFSFERIKMLDLLILLVMIQGKIRSWICEK